MIKKNEIERCDRIVIHKEIIDMVKGKIPEEKKLYYLAKLYKVFGDTTRIKILWALAESDMCVCDIAALLNMTQSAISHQLRILSQTRLIKKRKKGKVVYCSLNDAHIKQIIEIGLVHINEK